MKLEAVIELEKASDSDRSEQEGDRQARRINREQENSLRDGVLRSRKSQHERQDWAHARSPSKGEREADDECSPCSGTALETMESRVGEQGFDLKDAGQVQSKHNDDGAGDPRQQRFVLRKQLPHFGGNRAQRDEDDAEADDERGRVQHHLAKKLALIRFQLLDAHSRNQRDVSRHQREHAGREKRNQPGSESQKRQVESGHTYIVAIARAISAHSKGCWSDKKCYRFSAGFAAFAD